MKVEEYQDKFIELFKQLREEHGRIKEIEMYVDTATYCGGEIVSEKIMCKIIFE